MYAVFLLVTVFSQVITSCSYGCNIHVMLKSDVLWLCHTASACCYVYGAVHANRWLLAHGQGMYIPSTALWTKYILDAK